MIKDRLENANLYYKLSKNIQIGFEWLKSQDLEHIKPDKYFIKGTEIYANVQEYETKTNAKYESHKKYADIQYMIYGQELVGVCNKADCEICTPYNIDNDIDFMETKKSEEFVSLNQGEFLLLFQHDAHKPSMNPPKNTTKNIVKKVVVKVAID